MLQRQEATQTLLVLLHHPLHLPWGEKPGSWARGKLGGNVCDQGHGYSSGKWLLHAQLPLFSVPPWTPTLTRLLFSISFIIPAPGLLFSLLPFKKKSQWDFYWCSLLSSTFSPLLAPRASLPSLTLLSLRRLSCQYLHVSYLPVVPDSCLETLQVRVCLSVFFCLSPNGPGATKENHINI